jgi:hypothetical protein
MTIELGFVFLDDPGYAKQIVFIDVPGHERFVKTMAAGASNIDAALLVVAADEGIAVQTREHFDILRLLGVRLGAVALTKSDLVDTQRLAELTATVRDFLRGSFLADAPIVPVSALTGAGVRVEGVPGDRPPRPGRPTAHLPHAHQPGATIRGFGRRRGTIPLSGPRRVIDYPEVSSVRSQVTAPAEVRVGRRTLNLQDAAKKTCAAAGRGRQLLAPTPPRRPPRCRRAPPRDQAPQARRLHQHRQVMARLPSQAR